MKRFDFTITSTIPYKDEWMDDALSFILARRRRHVWPSEFKASFKPALHPSWYGSLFAKLLKFGYVREEYHRTSKQEKRNGAREYLWVKKHIS